MQLEGLWKQNFNHYIFATYVLVATLGCFMYQFLVGILTAVCAVKIGWNPEFFQDIIHRVKADG